MKEDILHLQALPERVAGAQGAAEAGFTHVGSDISIFSDCSTVSLCSLDSPF